MRLQALSRDATSTPGIFPPPPVGPVSKALVPGQEPGEGEPFRISEDGLDRGERSGWGGSGHTPGCIPRASRSSLIAVRQACVADVLPWDFAGAAGLLTQSSLPVEWPAQVP
jgi:hypothetical protein